MQTPPRRAFSIVLFCTLLMLAVLSSYPSARRAAMPPPAFGVITVTTANDFYGEDGQCSLREAIAAANTNVQVFECLGAQAGLDTIQFNLGSDTPVINVMTEGLPEITEPVVIDGATGGATRIELNGAGAGPDASGLMVNSSGGVTIKSLVINRFQVFGIFLRSNGNVIQNCYIGTDALGLMALGNTGDGILLEGSSNNTIGGTGAGQGNLISGNGSAGILIGDSSNNLILGNFIGTDVSGALALGNGGSGIYFDGEVGDSSGNSIGGTAANAGNTIAFNGDSGVVIKRSQAINNQVSSNSIFSNSSLGIDLVDKGTGVTANDADDTDTGPNRLQNFPVLTSVSAAGLISGTLNSDTKSSVYPVRLEFFANTSCDSSGNGEGEVYLGSTTLAAPGNFSFSATLIVGKNFITATATDNNGNTSEFSACQMVAANAAPMITASSPLTRQQASPGFNEQIATVSDADQAANTLTVRVNEGLAATVNGVTVSNLAVNASGQVTADVVAACAATNATFTLMVLDSLNASNTATLTVNVTDNSLPTLSYVAQTVAAGDGLTVNPSAGPSDNGSISNIAVLSQGTYTGTVSVNNSTGVVSFSNAKPGGMHSITIRVTDNCGSFTDASFTLEVVCPTIYLGPADLPSGTTTATYSETITANGGVGPYTFGTGRDPLPSGLSLSSGGLLTGTPSSAGVFNFVIVATDANGCVGNRAYTLLVNCVTIAPTSQNFAASGGTDTISLSAPGGCTWTAVSNDPWITVTGGASGSGNGTVSYSVAANAGNAPRTGTITIGSNLFAVQQSAPGVVVEEDLGNGIPPGWIVVDEGIGGGNAATWTTANPCSQSFPSLIAPPFLSVDVSCSGPGSAQDEQLILPPLDLSGMGRVLLQFNTQFKLDQGPTHTGDVDVSLDNGVNWVNVLRLQTADAMPVTKVVDLTSFIAANPSNVLIRFHYYGQLPNRPGQSKGGNRPTGGTDVIWPIDNLTLQSFAINPFNVNFGVAGGTGSVDVQVASTTVWTARSNVNWITAVTSGGTGSGSAAYSVAANLTGTPRIGTMTIAENTFTVNQAACGALTFDPTSLNNGTLGAQYSQTFNVSGGIALYTYSILNGALPKGLSLTTDGVLAGIPAQTGTFNFTIRVQDAVGCTGTQAYTLTINCPSITVNPATLNPLTAGAVFSQTFTQTGGNGAITWSFTGTLPTGLTLNATTGELAGTPTTPGNFSFTVVATDANNCTGSRAYSLTVNCPSITLTPATLPNAVVGTAYNQTVSASPAGAYNYTVTSGNLPNGLTLNSSTGVMSGMPTTVGTANFTITATIFGTCVGSQAYVLTTNCPSIAISPATLGAGTVGSAFSQTFMQAGGNGTIAWSFTGKLPTGLTLNAATGELAGTPTVPGGYSFTISATDANNCTGSRSYTLLVGCPTISITPTTLPGGTVGLPYSQMLAQTGGSGTIAWNFTGTLPTGLTLNPSTGALNGTPTATGSFSFTIIATDANNCTGSQAYSLAVNCPTITLAPVTLPPGGVSLDYNQTVSASPAGTYSYAVSAGSLPAGLTLDSKTGVLSGKPTAAGTANFTITATGFGVCTGSQAYTLTINCSAITITPPTLPSGSEGAPYNQALGQTGAVGTATWSISAGALPNGLSLNAASGVLSGATLAPGTFNFTVRATGSNGCFGERTYTLVVTNCPTLTLTPGTLPNVRLGNPYSQMLAGGGGQAPYNFTVTTGALPAGVTLATNGLIAGTPTQSGTFAFTVTVRDTNNCSGTQGYTLSVERGLVSADFEGDGRTDLSVWRPSTGVWYSRNSSDDAAKVQSWGAGYAPYNDVIVPGDYDGDGKTDYAVWRGQASIWYIRPSSSPGTPVQQLFGTSNAPYFDVPVQGDYDGDGKTDIAVWRPADGKWYVLKSSDGNYLIETWGTQGDIPVPGDYDGDGKVDFAQWRPSTGVWYIKKSSGGVQIIAWGLGVDPYFDVPVPADYDGDGQTDCAVWRKQDSIWYIRQSKDATTLTQFFGAPYAPYHDIAVPGDYDGDGKADIAVWRSADGTWYVRQSSDSAIVGKAFGQAGDVPIPAYGVR